MFAALKAALAVTKAPLANDAAEFALSKAPLANDAVVFCAV